MTYKELTAVQLADHLDTVAGTPHLVAVLSALDEATLAYRRKSQALDAAQRAFGNARYTHQRSFSPATDTYSEQAWQSAVDAAAALAAQLRPLGDTRILRCTRMSGHGVCGIPLDDDGVCRSTLGHTDDEPPEEKKP